MDKTNIGLTFRITADRFDTDLISQQLNIQPTKTRIKGNRISQNNTHKYTFTSWELGSTRQDSMDINDSLNQIIVLLKGKEDKLLAIKQQLHDVNFIFGFFVYVENSEIPSIYFKTSSIAFINSIQAEIDIDFYINS